MSKKNMFINRTFFNFLSSLFVVCLFYTPAYADELSETPKSKIGVVDFQKVVENSSAYKDIKSQLDKKADEFRDKAAKMQEVLQKGYQGLESQKSVLSTDSYGAKRKELDKKVESSQEKFHAERVGLDKASSEATSILDNSISEVIEKSAKDRDLFLVLASSSILYNDSSLDITDSVIEQLNKKLPSVVVKFEDGGKGKKKTSPKKN